MGSVSDFGVGGKLVRGAVRSCVSSMAGYHKGIVAQTSGGLDSSIVLGCLSDVVHDLKVTCYTAYLKDAVCDERRWARLVRERAGYRGIDGWRETGPMGFRDLPALAPKMQAASSFSHSQPRTLGRE